MDLQCQVLVYLDEINLLKEMKICCKNFLNELMEKNLNKYPPFRYLMEIDIMHMLEMFPEIGQFILKEPNKFHHYCNEVLYACLKSLDEDVNDRVGTAQVAVNLRLKSIPRLLINLNSHTYKGLVSFQGLLLAVSKPSNYVYHTVWSCPEECEGNEVVLHYIPKVPPKCYVCRSVLFENSGLRRCGEQVTATFKQNNNLLSKNITLVDDLIHKLKIGSIFDVGGFVMKKTAVVWSLEELIPLPAPITSTIPSDIQELYDACEGSPWQFIYCLASSIGVRVCPLYCFIHLKVTLILSLASVKASQQTDSTIIHVLAAGYDTGYVGRLMEEAVNLADRCVVVGSSHTLPSTALIASSGGVCVMPLPLHTYNQKYTSSILSSLETREILTEERRVNLRSAVWAHGMDFKKMILLNVASVFGTVCRGDCGEYNDDIVDFMLQNAIEPPRASKEEKGALKDIASYIDLVSGIKVLLDERTETLLKNYFLVARKETPRGVTALSMEALVAACITSARLCRRSIANIDDAVFAIWLHVSGSPEPRIAPEEYLQTPANIKKLKKIMNNFKDWLEQFVGSYI